ncbi:MAG: hypothetical protein ACK4K5_08825 [Thermosynechococcus sp.]
MSLEALQSPGPFTVFQIDTVILMGLNPVHSFQDTNIPYKV